MNHSWYNLSRFSGQDGFEKTGDAISVSGRLLYLAVDQEGYELDYAIHNIF